jgi:hypothetical protein
VSATSNLLQLGWLCQCVVILDVHHAAILMEAVLVVLPLALGSTALCADPSSRSVSVGGVTVGFVVTLTMRRRLIGGSGSV